ncbi:MAG: hypothetical protein OFPI_37200 [Osedax symbiont Rs2]|nr:MAG: hypothetical protein OFPI_37200 [Osedax symbiont Rs2]
MIIDRYKTAMALILNDINECPLHGAASYCSAKLELLGAIV